MSFQIIPLAKIEQRIFVFRNEKVNIDRDLAELYQVSTKAFDQSTLCFFGTRGCNVVECTFK